MKYLRFKKTETFQPLAVSKKDVKDFVNNGKTDILVNGIMTALLKSVSNFKSNLEEIKASVAWLVGHLANTNDVEVEVSITGSIVLVGKEDKENYVFSAYKVTPEYTEK